MLMENSQPHFTQAPRHTRDRTPGTVPSHTRLRLWLGMCASAGLLTVIQPPLSWNWLAWIAWVPFILACVWAPSQKAGLGAAYVVGVAYWLINLHFLIPITMPGWAAFCLYSGLQWPLIKVALTYCTRKRIPLFLSSAVILVGAERLQGLFLGGFFWRFLAHSQYAHADLIQIADIFGAAGVSFLIAMTNGLVADIVVAVHGKTLKSWVIFAGSGCTALPLAAALVYGHWRIAQFERIKISGPVVAAVQSNVPQSVKDSFEASDRIFADALSMSQAAADTHPYLIAWPETMVQTIMNADLQPLLTTQDEWTAYDTALGNQARNTCNLLVGAYGGKIKRSANGDIELGRFNSVFHYGPDGKQSPEHYDKMHLVLFGEYLPFRESWPWLFHCLMKCTPYEYDYSLDAGKDYTLFKLPAPDGNDIPASASLSSGYQVGVLICYEDTIPAIARHFVVDDQGNKQVDWLVNVSNDGWFVSFKDTRIRPSSELTQHLAACVFRAVETRAGILRSVNTGISCLIDPCGRIQNSYLAASPGFPIKATDRQGVAGWFSGEMPIDARVSFFSRHGQWLDGMCAAALGLATAIPVIDRVRSTRKKSLKKSME